MSDGQEFPRDVAASYVTWGFRHVRARSRLNIRGHGTPFAPSLSGPAQRNDMKLPLEILTKGHRLGEGALQEIRSAAEKLDLFYGRIMRCRVAVEGPGGHARQGRWRVAIELRVPGKEITVTRQ